MKQLIKRLWFRWVLVFTGILLLLFILRNPILRGIGNYLVADDSPSQVDACFILGGNSFERGLTAIQLAHQFPNQYFVATGGNFPLQIQALDTLMTEAELTRHFMIRKGVEAHRIATLSASTSTQEESEEILSYCQKNNLRRIAILSSSFHTRRVRWVFEKKFKKAGIEVLFFASPTEQFDASNWWKNEEGLITCNNEYLKLIYYTFRY